jgi:hypothetical protein
MQNFLNFCIRWSTVVTLPTILLTLSIPIRPAAAGNEFDTCITELIDSGVSAKQAGVACSDALIPKELSECVGKIREGTPIKPEDAVTACYRVRRPVDLANCVVDIHDEILVSATPSEGNKSDTTPKTKAIESAQEPASPPPTEPVEPGSAQEPTSPPPTEPAEPSNAEPIESPTMTDTETSPSLVALDSCRRSLLPGRYSQCVIAVSQDVPDTKPVEAMATCLSAEDFPRDLFPAFTNN